RRRACRNCTQRKDFPCVETAAERVVGLICGSATVGREFPPLTGEGIAFAMMAQRSNGAVESRPHGSHAPHVGDGASLPPAARVLIVDDNAEYREVFGELAQLSNCTPVLADSLNAARRLVLDQTFDLIVLDLNLPDGNGLD